MLPCCGLNTCTVVATPHYRERAREAARVHLSCLYLTQPFLYRVSSYCDRLADPFFKGNVGPVFSEHLHTNDDNNRSVAPLTVTRTHTYTCRTCAVFCREHEWRSRFPHPCRRTSSCRRALYTALINSNDRLEQEFRPRLSQQRPLRWNFGVKSIRREKQKLHKGQIT